MDEGKDVVQTSYKKSIYCRRAGSRMCHGLMAVSFLLMMAVSFTSLGIFAAKHNSISRHLPKSGTANCILYVDKDDLSDEKLSKGVGCRFAIWGSAVVALGTGLFMLGYLLKLALGAPL